MTPLPATVAMRAVARRVIWFEEPEVALSDPIRFMAYAMAYATHEDMKEIRRHVDDDAFREAIDNAPPGIIDPRSWAYWNLKMGRFPAPPPPTRRFECGSATRSAELPEHAPLIQRLAGTGGLHNYGPFGGEAQALAILRDRLVAALDPLELHLFGSRGRGTARPDSDFDLLVVLPDAVGEAGLDPFRAYAPVMGLGIGADVVPCLASDFEAEKDIPGTIAHDAKRGRLIYRRVAG
ncbi:MAG: nucleotidyltransferase domain-containing protein [Alphaproteobacteria bacterium]|nr:nucleotidyltransferase domain-containing protein [Alphaproteobacteria bacterium]